MLNSIGGLWHRIGSAFERSDIDGGEARDAPGGAEAVRPTTTRYAPIREAVERRVKTFLRQDVVSHLEIGFNEIFLLHYIEISADKQGAPMLAQFLQEFPPDSRVHWVKKLLGPAVGQHVQVDQFLGLDEEFSAEELAETDPFEDQLNQNAAPLYRVILHGRWESAPAPQAPQAPQSPQEPEAPKLARRDGPRLRLQIQDAKESGPHTLEIEQYPAVLGSSTHADIEVSGYYVSARHCTLHWEGQQLWLADHSTNGTWVDGVRIHRGSRVALANGAVLGFGRVRRSRRSSCASSRRRKPAPRRSRPPARRRSRRASPRRSPSRLRARTRPSRCSPSSMRPAVPRTTCSSCPSRSAAARRRTTWYRMPIRACRASTWSSSRSIAPAR